MNNLNINPENIFAPIILKDFINYNELQIDGLDE
jgi:hypothetical protein